LKEVQWCTKPKAKQLLFKRCWIFCRTYCLSLYILFVVVYRAQTSSYYFQSSKSSLSDGFWRYMKVIQGVDWVFIYLNHVVINYKYAIISVRLKGVLNKSFGSIWIWVYHDKVGVLQKGGWAQWVQSNFGALCGRMYQEWTFVEYYSSIGILISSTLRRVGFINE